MSISGCQFCSHLPACPFISTIEECVNGASEVWERFRLKPIPTRRSGHGYPHRYSKESILKCAAETYTNCDEWQNEIRKSNDRKAKRKAKEEQVKEQKIVAAKQFLNDHGVFLTETQFKEYLELDEYMTTSKPRVHYCTNCNSVVHKDHSTQTRGICSSSCVQGRVFVGNALPVLPNMFYCFLCKKYLTGIPKIHHHFPIDEKHLLTHHILPNVDGSKRDFIELIHSKDEHKCKLCDKHKSYVCEHNHNVLRICNAHAPKHDKLYHLSGKSPLKDIVKKYLNTPNGTVLALTKAKPDIRYKFRKLFAKDIYIESRGYEHDRLLLAWRKTDVMNVLTDFLPADIVNQLIIPKLNKIYMNESMAKEQKKTDMRANIQSVNQKRFTCEVCGSVKFKNDMGVSPYVNALICFDCIEDDDELSNHKWESL